MEFTLKTGATLDSVKFVIQNGVIGDSLQQNGGNTLCTYNTSSFTLSCNTSTIQSDADAIRALVRSITFSTTSTNYFTRNISIGLGSAIPGPNGNFYQVSTSSTNYSDALSQSANNSYLGLTGYLATITTQEENDFVNEKLNGRFWIALSDRTTEGTWKWDSGPESGTTFATGNGASYQTTVAGFRGFASGEPNDYSTGEDCTELRAPVGNWNDMPCTTSFFYVTEYGDGTGNTPGSLTSLIQTSKSVEVVTHVNIFFNVNGGSGSMSNQIVAYNTSSTLNANTYIRTGHSFSSWNTAPDGTGTSYTNGDSVTLTSNLTLYAQWTVNNYDVQFNANNGTGSITNQSITFDSSSSLALNNGSITRSGYTFTGWNTQADGSGTDYADGATFTMNIEGDELFAQWSLFNYSITYDYNLTPISPTNPHLYREFIIPANKIDANLSNFPLTIILDETNYDFTGITYSGIYFTDANNTLLDFEVDAVSTSPNKVVYHVRVPAISSSQDTPIRVFYSTLNDYSNGNNSDNVWDANYIFVSHMGAGITNVASATSVIQVNSITYSSGLLGNVANFNGGFIELPSSLNTSAFTKIILATPSQTNAVHNLATSANDSVFWIYQGDLRATYTNGFKPLTILASPTIQNNQLGFFANRFSSDDSFIWYNNSSTSITEISNNRLAGRASIVIGAYDTDALNPFRGTMDEVRISNIGRSDAWIKAEYYSLTNDLLEYSGLNPVSYDINSGTITLSSPNSLHRTFNSWFENADLITSGITQIPSGSLGNKTLYASWTDVSYSITYDANGGTVVSPITNYSISSGTITLPTATKEGFQFDGWFENADLVTSGISQLPSGSFGNRILYAKWSEVPYSITYNSNGGSVVTAITSYSIGSGTITLPNATKAGYVLEGWYETSDFSTSTVVTFPSTDIQNKIFYAQWEPAPLVTPSFEFLRRANQDVIRLFSVDSGINPTFEGIEYNLDSQGWVTYTTEVPLGAWTMMEVRPVHSDGTTQSTSQLFSLVTVSYYSGLTLLQEDVVVSGLVNYRVLDRVTLPNGQIITQWYSDQALSNALSSLAVNQNTSLYGTPVSGIYEGNSGLINTQTNFSFANAAVTNAGVIRISSDQLSVGDFLTILSDPNPFDIGAISFDGGFIYKGLGNGTKEKIASIDSIVNGQNGNDLLLNISALLYNGDFANGLDGWIAGSGTFAAGTHMSGFYDVPDDLDYSKIESIYMFSGVLINNSVRSDGFIASNVNRVTAGNKGQTNKSYLYDGGEPQWRPGINPVGNFTVSVTNGMVALVNTGNVTNYSGSYGSLHGPTILSENYFSAAIGDNITFQFEATKNNDDADVYAFVIDESVTPAKYIPIFYQRVSSGTSRGYARYTFSSGDFANGATSSSQLRYFFVGGSFDASGGYHLGATFKIDNISLESSATFSRADLNAIIDRISLQAGNTNPETEYEFEVRAEAGPTLIESGLITRTIKPVNNSILVSGIATLLYNPGQSLPFDMNTRFRDEDSTLSYSGIGLPPFLELESSGILKRVGGGGFAQEDEGTHTFIIRAMDGQYSLDRIFELKVNYQNDAPEVNNNVTLVNKRFAASLFSSTFTLPDLLFTDPDLNYDDSLTLSLSNQPACMSLNSSTRVISMTNCNVSEGTVVTVTLTATDIAGLTASRTFTTTFTNSVSSTLTFNSNGGSNVVSITGTIGSGISAPVPFRPAYTFGGWFTELSLVNEFDFVNGIPASDTTLYAKWTPISYAITYYLNSGVNAANPEYYDVTSGTITLLAPSRTHYTFNGWFTNSGLTSGISQITTGTSGVFELYATWTPNPFVITYNLNNGSIGANPGTFTIEDEVILTSGSRTGYTFAGWFSDEELTTQVTKIPLGTITPQTVYAKWNVINYPIQYVFNIGNSALKGSYTIEDETYVFPPAGSAGREFIGWFYDSAFTREATQITAGSIGPVTVYAKWQAYEYTLSFRADGRTVESISVIFGEPVPGINPAIPEKKGHTAVGWDSVPPATMPARSVRISAIYEINQYTTTYEDDEGNVLGSETLDYGSALTIPTAPDKEGYTFTGWSSTASTMPDSDITIKAQYEAIEYTVTFSDGDTTISSAQVKFGDPVSAPSAPDKEGFEFDSWSGLPETMPASDVTVTAVYTEVEEEPEEETPEEPTRETPSTTGSSGGSGGVITTRPITPTTPTIPEIPEVIPPVELPANPDPIVTRVKVEGLTLDISIIPGEPIGELPEAALTGYTFTGWMNALTGEMLNPESVIDNPEFVVLTPIFEKTPNILDAARRVFSTVASTITNIPTITNDNTTRTDNIVSTNEYGSDVIDTIETAAGVSIEVRADGTALVELSNEKRPITIDATQFDLPTIEVSFIVGTTIPEFDDEWRPYQGEPFLSNQAAQSVYIKVQDGAGAHQVTYLKEATFISNPEMIPVRVIVETSVNRSEIIEQLVLTPNNTCISTVEYDGEMVDLFVIDPDEKQDLIEVVVRYQANDHNQSLLIGVNAATWREVILKPVEVMGIYVREDDNLPFTLEYRFTDDTSVIEEFNVVKSNTIVEIVITPEPNQILLYVLMGLVTTTLGVQLLYPKKKEA